MEEFERDCGLGHIVTPGDYGVVVTAAAGGGGGGGGHHGDSGGGGGSGGSGGSATPRESLADKASVHSALQSYADLVMDECFMSVFAAFVHLRRVNKYLS